jgi:hypothetical protein
MERICEMSEETISKVNTFVIALMALGIVVRTFLWFLVTVVALIILFKFSLASGLCFLVACGIGWYFLFSEV